jgi:bifunctional DNase/RNase
MVSGTCKKPGCGNPMSTVALIRSESGELTELAFCKDHLSSLGGGYYIPNPTLADAQATSSSYEQCRFKSVVFAYGEAEQFSLVLVSTETEMVFVVPVGYPEACLIYQALKYPASPTPRTHQLMAALIHLLGGSLIEAVVEGFDTATQAYKCYLAVETTDGVARVECRGTDAVALTLFTTARIRVSSSLLGHDLSIDSGM